VAVFNIDALNTDGLARDITTSGNGKVSLQDDIAAAAQAEGRHFTPDPNPEAGHFFRSDHFPFAKAGVPAISIGSGDDLVKGGVAAGKAWGADYVAHHYHQPSDEWSASWDLSGQVADLNLIQRLGAKLANSDQWPDWQEGSEFKAIRAISAAERK